MADPPESEPTGRLIARFVSGDESAFEELFERYEPLVRWLIRARLKGAERRRLDESDLLQTAFFKVARNLSEHRYQEEGQFRAWLARSVRNKVEDSLRREHADRRDVQREVGLDTGMQVAEPSHRVTLTQRLDRIEEATRLQDALEQLPSGLRDVILVRDFERQTWPDAAATLECAQSTVRERYKKAHAALGRLLAPPE